MANVYAALQVRYLGASNLARKESTPAAPGAQLSAEPDVEWISPQEQVYMDIACTPEDHRAGTVTYERVCNVV